MENHSDTPRKRRYRGGGYDFDQVPDRRGGDSYKWSIPEGRDVIPLWVADMDFPVSPVIIRAMYKRLEQRVFGYVRVPDSYYKALQYWFYCKHGWLIHTERVIYTSGVVPAVSAIIKALTRPGEGVVVQTPAYNCFFSSIRNNGCRIVENPLRRVDTPTGFTYEIDFDDLERKCAEPDVNLLLLCNPHNPTGRIWTRDELTRLRDICRRHGVRVVSDEIHCDITMPHRDYNPYGLIDDRAIICNSPSKAFNIAGLQIANIVNPDEETQAKVDRAINDNEVCDVNPFGVVALEAAYRCGILWLEDVCDYIADNYRMLREFFAEHLPSLPVCDLEATYLAWVDVTSLGIPSAELEKRLLDSDDVWINAGEMYGLDGYIRINMACPRDRLQEGLRRLASGIGKLRSGD